MHYIIVRSVVNVRMVCTYIYVIVFNADVVKLWSGKASMLLTNVCI